MSFNYSTVLYITDRLSPFSYQNNSSKYVMEYDKRIFTYKESLWFCLMCLTPQGGGPVPKSISGKLVTGTWWLFGFVSLQVFNTSIININFRFIMVASYTANLAAFLTINRLETGIESLEDLADQHTIQFAPLTESTEMEHFRRMAAIEKRFYDMWLKMTLNESLTPMERLKYAVWEYPLGDTYTKLWRTIKNVEAVHTLDEAVNRVRNSTFTSGINALFLIVEFLCIFAKRNDKRRKLVRKKASLKVFQQKH